MTTLFHIAPRGFNVGNHAIRLALNSLLHDAFGQVVNVVALPATSRYESSRRAGLTAETVHEINQYGDGVIIGGGNLYENGELDVDLNALSALEVPLLLFSLSWGRIYNRAHELRLRTDAMPDTVIKALNDRAMVSLARDQATLDHLHAIGATEARLGGCPTIFLNDLRARLPDVGFEDAGAALISVRVPQLMNVPLPVQARIHRQVDELALLLTDSGHDRVRLLCHDHRDIPFAASFPHQEYTYTDDPMTYLALLASCSINVGYRLHAALPCAAFGRPFVKLSYDERALSLLETVGLQEWNVDIVTSPDPLALVENRLKRVDELSETVSAARSVWQDLRSVQTGALAEFAAEVQRFQSLNGSE